MLLDEVYFWTATLKDWKTLLGDDEYKIIILDTLKELVSREKIIVYAFVIMPNHIHLVWEMKALNGKEMPHASFNKFTAHQFQKTLKLNDPELLNHFKVEETERKYRFWKRDSLAILMDSKEKVFQKIDYVHNNPLQEKWNLAETPESYKWSSAKFYEIGKDDFNFLTNIAEIF
ncbi:MAG: transposase [Bacteroidetes bacterium]|nr:transposase [Bacteroidota bacterium]MBU1372885.1 transposase [Bacteroidota bacterium]MBU1485614.1 transposase [Bacteroidota bacterium]MBU1761435.1 transposase [Bacteroidota bacterium]MBU2268905.1 transposase [Bacteroidota bacterium]